MRGARFAIVVVVCHVWLSLLSLLSGRFGVPEASAAPLRTSATAKGMFIGAAVNMAPFRSEAAYTETLRREFNMLVGENAFKFDAMHPAATTFNFTDTDALVAFAEANGMAIRGHTLVWHSQLPGWLTGGSFTRDQVIAIMRDHIMTVVGRYRGLILAWDVVNEAVGDGGQLRTESLWFQRIGPEYIAMAFQFAREADPDAILYYNDFEAEGGGAKSDGVFNLVSGLVNQGVPIDGVGWQMHKINPFRISAANRSNAQRLAALGLELSITEMDIRIQLPADAQELQQQSLGYGDAVTFCLSEPSCAAVVTWGFTDKYSWVPSVFNGFGDALIFDTNFQAKPAYTAMQAVLEAGLGTPPPVPTGLQATAGQAQVQLTWNASPGATSYNVKRSTTSGGPYTVVGTPTTTSFTSTGLVNGTTYFFVVSAVNSNGQSANSAQVSATPQSVPGPGPGTGGVTVTPVIAASGPWFNEQQLRITSTAPITALAITLVIQRTGNISFSGQYNTVGGQITQSNNSTAAAVTYQFGLAPGQTLGPASGRVFAAQTGGTGTVHPMANDTYTVTYTTGGQSFTQTGHF